MKVKAVDIARALGLSKTTVSFALNGKPGVSDKTRQRVLDYKKRAEEGRLEKGVSSDTNNSADPAGMAGRLIAVLMVSGGMKNIRDNELDLWTDVKAVLEKDFHEHGYSMMLIYTDINDKADFMSAVTRCNAPEIAGVMVDATELQKGQTEQFESIHKPLIFYDYEEGNEKYSFISINNRQAVCLAVDELMRTGNHDIIYLGMTMPMYNYQSRRQGFLDSMTGYGYTQEEAGRRIVPCADTIMGARNFMLDYLEHHPLPQAFLCDSYHESIGLMEALTWKKIRVPDDVSVIGIDALPEYITRGIRFTSIRVSHTARGKWAAEAMYREIKEPLGDKIQLYVNCSLVKGETVADRYAIRRPDHTETNDG